jgi:hypothetical protein
VTPPPDGTERPTAPAANPPPSGPRQWPALWLLALCVAVAAGALLERVAVEDGGHLLAYLGAALLGLLVGATELVSRYRDAPLFALQTAAGLIYMAVNAAVSLIVFWLLRTGQIGMTLATAIGPTLSQVLLAGVGSMALLRTSLFTLRVRETDVPVGPAAILQVILVAADRACDRDRAGPRAAAVKRIMLGVSFQRARLALPGHCLSLMQNISADERSQLDSAISVLAAAQMSDEVKSYNLGLVLMNYVGEDVLQEAVLALGPVIQGPPGDDPPILAQASTFAFADLPALIEICAAIDPVPRTADPAALRTGWITLDAALTREPDRVLVVLARLRAYFGPDTLAKAMAYLAAGRKKITPDTAPLTSADLAPPATH